MTRFVTVDARQRLTDGMRAHCDKGGGSEVQSCDLPLNIPLRHFVGVSSPPRFSLTYR
jgi:hypothetical protein